MKAVTIIAGGWSARMVDLNRVPGFVIAVNDSAVYAPRWDAAISMDRLWFENRHEQVLKAGKPLYMRENAIKRPVENGLIHRFACDHESTVLAEPAAHRRLNGTHSGFCAINLAYQMRPLELFLVGFDMSLGPRGERHWYEDYPWNPRGTGPTRLAEWAMQFGKAAIQLRDAGVTTHLVESKIGMSIPGWFDVDAEYMERLCVA